jgi:hypothetical protein
MFKKTLLIVLVLGVVFSSAVMADDSSGGSPKRVGLPITLNIIPGFGLGSFIQGDTTGGLIGLGGCALGEILYYAGYLTYYQAVLDWNGYGTAPTDGMGTYLLGGAILTGTLVFGIVRPITFAKKYNRDHGFAVNVLPTIASTSMEGKVAATPGALVTLSY